MVTTVSGPAKLLKTLNGPVSMAVLPDGSIFVAGPEDKPFLIRNGAIMEIVLETPHEVTFGFKPRIYS
jgi:hypothetical protein